MTNTVIVTLPLFQHDITGLRTGEQSALLQIMYNIRFINPGVTRQRSVIDRDERLSE
jgi:hypothetical protein